MCRTRTCIFLIVILADSYQIVGFLSQISFTCILFPSVALCYMGQAAYLRKFPENVGDTFYKSIPSRWCLVLFT